MHEAKLTWTELRRRYPNRWIMLVELDWRDDELRSGVAIGDGRTRSAAIMYGLPLLDLYGERDFAVFYTGATEAPARRFPAPPRATVQAVPYEVTAPMFSRQLAS